MVSTTTITGDDDGYVTSATSVGRPQDGQQRQQQQQQQQAPGRITRVFGFVKNLVFNRTSDSAARAMGSGGGAADGGGGGGTGDNRTPSSSDDTSDSFASMSLRSIISITSIMDGTGGGEGGSRRRKVKFSGNVLIRVIPNLDEIGTANHNIYWWQRNDYDTFEHNNTRIEELMTKSYYGTIGLTAGRKSNSRQSRHSQRRPQYSSQPPKRSNSADSYDSTDSNDGGGSSTMSRNGNGNINEDRFEYCTRGLECRTPIAERQRSKSRDDARHALFGGPFGSGAMFENNDVIAETYERACFPNVQAAHMRGLYDEKVMKELLQDDDEFLIYYHDILKKSEKDNNNNGKTSTTSIVPPPPSYYGVVGGTPTSSAVSPAQLQQFRKEREEYMKSRSKRRYRNTTAGASSSPGR